MSIFKKFKKEKPNFDEAIKKRVDQLDMTIGDADEDAKEIENIKTLVDCKNEMKGKQPDWSLNPIISGLFGLGGIILLISHERDGVIASKVSSIVPVSKFFNK